MPNNIQDNHQEIMPINVVKSTVTLIKIVIQIMNNQLVVVVVHHQGQYKEVFQKKIVQNIVINQKVIFVRVKLIVKENVKQQHNVHKVEN